MQPPQKNSLFLLLALIASARCGALLAPSDGQLLRQTRANDDLAPQSEEDGERMLDVSAGSPLSIQARFAWQRVVSQMFDGHEHVRKSYQPVFADDHSGLILLDHMKLEREKKKNLQDELLLLQGKEPGNGQDNQPAESVDKRESTLFSWIKKMFKTSRQDNARGEGSEAKKKSFFKKLRPDKGPRSTHLRDQGKEPGNPLGKKPGNSLDKEVGKDPGNVHGRNFRESVKASVGKPEPTNVSKTKKGSAVFGQDTEPGNESVHPVVQSIKRPVQPVKESFQSSKEPGKNSEASVEGPKPRFASWIKQGAGALKMTIANVITRLWNFLTFWRK
uniref:Uncharacterized protein n=1 Tax=Peronospora matthiolae TaxID=2874970 RepID=A0AAV1U483_9STRA